MNTTRPRFFPSAGARAAAVALCAAAVTGTTALAAPKTIELPQETATYKPGAGVEIANAQCMTCHSADYVKYQPPSMTRANWTAEIKKMQHFGSPIPDDQIAPLAEYLAKNYGNEQGK